MVHIERTNLHNRLLDYAVSRLGAAGYSAAKELVITTSAGVWKPDVFAWRADKDSWVLDAQMLADASAGDVG